jgi:hypothetical protein
LGVLLDAPPGRCFSETESVTFRSGQSCQFVRHNLQPWRFPAYRDNAPSEELLDVQNCSVITRGRNRTMSFSDFLNLLKRSKLSEFVPAKIFFYRSLELLHALRNITVRSRALSCTNRMLVPAHGMRL